MRRPLVKRSFWALFGGPFRWANRLHCRLSGHAWETKTFDGRGKRIQVTCCRRCRYVERGSMQTSCLNRRVRRQSARALAKELIR